jgi:two-component system response regulator AtoC
MVEGTILVVDDDDAVAAELDIQLRCAGASTVVVNSAKAAHAVLNQRSIDLVISDIIMPGDSGLQLLKELRATVPEVPVVLMTGKRFDKPNIDLGAEAMRAGAADFLEKPWKREELLHVVQKELKASSGQRGSPPPSLGTTGRLVGESEALKRARHLIGRAAATESTVLILGETGTGKELAAREIHDGSRRSGHPYVALNCAAVAKELFEAELFGTAKGAFTGAGDRPGRVGIARGGTLFLDEVGELPDKQQAALLRLIEARTYERVGSDETRQADVRIIAATHRPLRELADQGDFRKDFYGRLGVVTVELPPLREHLEDVPGLARHLLASLATQMGRPAHLTDGAVALLQKQQWERGNVRELRNFLEGLLVMSDRDDLDEGDVASELERRGGSPKAPAGAGQPEPLAAAVRLAEEAAIRKALAYAKGRRDLAARILAISRRSLFYKMQEYGLG